MCTEQMQKKVMNSGFRRYLIFQELHSEILLLIIFNIRD